MKIFDNIKSIGEELARFSGKRIGLVPTMGALHNGHLSLIDLAQKHCDIVVVSIFVNQKQFNNPEDYALYPNTFESDIKYLEDKKVDILFSPQVTEIYSNNFFTKINVSKLTDHLCGRSRVGHFDAVALIVTKLFNIIKPQQAFFGEKDFQQLRVIETLVKDLNIDVDIIAGGTIREAGGLAMSSRNSRLSDDGKKIAENIYCNLCLAKERIISGANIDKILSETIRNLLAIGIEKVDYLQVCNEEALQPIFSFNPNIKSRLFIAAHVDNIRLIDNIKL